MPDLNPVTLSIITITYNEPKALEMTLESLVPLNSVPLSWEQIVVDSSPALNQEVIRSHSAGRPLVHLPQQPEGIYPAMNAGLNKSSGEFVWFLNGGDILSSADTLMETIRELLRNPGTEMAMAGAELTRDGAFHYLQHPKQGIAPMLGINRVCQQAVIYRKTLFERIGKFSPQYRLAADYEFHLRAHSAGAKTLLVDRALVRYDLGGQSSNHGKVFSEFKRIHEDLALAGKLPWPVAQPIARSLEWFRISLFKRVGSTPLAPALRKAWQKYRRFRG